MPDEAIKPDAPFAPLTFESGAPPNATACQSCGVPLRGSYHMVGEAMVCSKCRYAAEALAEGATGAAGLMRALGFGVGAAIIGAIGYYTFVKVTNIEWALITVLVGLGVGKAVRIGSRGHGGRKFQFVALALTYLAMAGAYLPFIAEGFASGAKHPGAVAAAKASAPPTLRAYADSSAALQGATGEETDSSSTPASAAPSAAPARPAAPDSAPSAGFVVLAVLVALVSAPVLVAVASPISGICIAFALYRAWKSNAGTPPPAVSGPFRLQAAPGAPDPT